jgi:hypothetical protein
MGYIQVLLTPLLIFFIIEEGAMNNWRGFDCLGSR